MAYVDHKQGSTFYTYLEYATPSLTTADFTILVYQNGSPVANTGITITYLADNQYIVACNGSTSFASGTGTFDLVVYRTSIVTDRWTDTVRVTNTGSIAAGSGTANFTSTASNGRVTDGTNPIQGATIIIYRPSYASVWSQTTTASDGNWGPVSFDSNGTYPVIVQRGGYSQVVSNLQVVGSTVTGPGTDIELDVVTSTSSTMTASQLWAYARRMYRDRTGPKADQELKEVVDEALQMLATDRLWPYYLTFGRLNLIASQSTGTVSTTYNDATVTLSGATWPTWTVDAEILIGTQWQRILTRTDDTHIELTDIWNDDSQTNVAYTLAKLEYTLPSDCMRIEATVNKINWPWGPDPVSRGVIEMAKRQWRQGIANPALWSIEKDKLVIWPWSPTNQMMNLLYYRRPAQLVNSTDPVDWDPSLIEVLRRAIDYMVSCRGDCAAGTRDECFQAYKEAKGRAIIADRTTSDIKVGLSRAPYDPVLFPGQMIQG